MNNGKHGVIMGNAPSSGSSLLASLLAEAEGLYHKGERYVYDKPDWIAGRTPDLKRNWQSYCKRGYARHFPCESFILFADFARIPDFAGSPLTYAEFVHRKLLDEAKENDSDWYIEKTPNNAFSLSLIHALLPEARFIVCHRHPVDTYKSLRRRGYSAYTAVARWYFPNLALLPLINTERVKFVPYDRLTREPRRTLEEIFDFIGRSFDERILNQRREDSLPQIRAWTRAADGPIIHQQHDEVAPKDMAVIFFSMRARDEFYAYVGGIRDTATPIELAHRFGYDVKFDEPSLKARDPRKNFPVAEYLGYFKNCIMNRRTVRPLWHWWDLQA
jgi:hypothetical protein